MTACNVTQHYAFAVGGKCSLCLHSPCIAHTCISLATPSRSHSACYTSWITKKTGLQQNGIKMGFCQYYGNDPATLHGVQLV